VIYFLQSVEGGPVKIGHSGDVPSRIESLEAHYKKRLALLGTMPGGRDEEREVHERFAHLRFGRTEQFRPAPELMAFIGRPLLVGANPDAVEAMPGPGTGLRHARIELPDIDFQRLKRASTRVHISLSAYIRQAVMERIEADERKAVKP
jgi:hypothetical protein